MHSPSFLYGKDRSGKAKADFAKITYMDIKETMKFLYKRGMWSKYHFMQWTKALEELKNNEEELHLWWDAIVSGAMFETDALLKERLEALKEFEEDELEKKKMMMKQGKCLAKMKQ